MTNISHIIISDLHLGERIGILNKIDEQDYKLKGLEISEAAIELIRTINYLLGKQPEDQQVSLVLNGDLLGMSFGKIHETLTILASFLKHFFEEISPNRIKEIIYIPGNHDHHMWEMARETDFVKNKANRKDARLFPTMKHTTGPFASDGIQSAILDAVYDCIDGRIRSSELPDIKVVYPNLICYNAEKNKVAIIHHGHFVEDLYNFISLTRQAIHPEIQLPSTIEEIEQENFAWIDFLFSMLGRSGKAGVDVELIMKIMGNPNSSEKEIDILSDRVAEKLDFPFIPFNFLEKYLTKTLIKRISKKANYERGNEEFVCSEETIQDMLKYISGPCMHQCREHISTMPSNVSFIWGHTHKPFVKQHLSNENQVLKIYNTGGWTVDGLEPDPWRGGTIAFMDTDFNIVNVQIFDNRDADGEITLNVKSVDTDNELEQRIQKLIIDMPDQQLLQLKAKFAKEILLRRKYYKNKTLFKETNLA